MYYIQFVVNLHNPEEFEFNYKRTGNEHFLLDEKITNSYYAKGCKLFKEKEEMTLLDHWRQIMNVSLWNNGEYMFWDFFHKEKKKFFRAYTFILSHTHSPNMRTMVQFEPSEEKKEHKVSIFSVDDSEKHFQLVENNFNAQEESIDKYMTYISEKKVSEDSKGMEKALFLKVNFENKTNRQYIFLLEE